MILEFLTVILQIFRQDQIYLLLAILIGSLMPDGGIRLTFSVGFELKDQSKLKAVIHTTKVEEQDVPIAISKS
jgi:hypothetical protein